MGFLKRLRQKVVSWFKPKQTSNASAKANLPTIKRVNRGSTFTSSASSASSDRRQLLDNIRGRERTLNTRTPIQTTSALKENPYKAKKFTRFQTSSELAKPKIDTLRTRLDSATPKRTAYDPKEIARQSARARLEARRKKMDEELEKRRKERLESTQKYLDKRKEEREAFHKSTNHKYDTKYGSKEQRARARQRLKSGEYQSDPDVMKHEVKYHPIAASASRGALSGTTFGLSDLAARKLTKGKAREAEEYYQKHKNKKAEIAGEVVGSLASFGATAGATEKLGAKAVGKVAPRAAEKLAEKELIKKAATKSVEKAVKKGLVKESTEELIKEVGRKKAQQIVNAVGGDVVQNLTTGAIYDLANASKEYEVGSDDWWKEMGKSAAINFGITGGIAGVSALKGSKRLAAETADELGRKYLKETTKNTVAKNADNIKGVVEFPPKNNSTIDVINPDLERRGKTVEFGQADDGIEVINPNVKKTAKAPEVRQQEARPQVEEAKAEIEVPKAGKLSAAEKQAKMWRDADEKADAIRAELGAEPPEPVKERITKPADVKKEYTVQLTRENGRHQTVKVEAATEKEALDKAIGRKKGVKNAKTLGSTEAQPKAELPNAQAAKQEAKSINLDDAVNKKRVKKTFREQFREFTASAKTKISDSLNAFEEANKQYIKTDHKKWLENVGAIDKTRRYNAIAGRSIDDAQVKWNGDVFEDGKSLKAIYDGMDEATEKDFDKYLLMRHAPDRIREGKPIFAGTQYDSVEACEREANALLEKHPEFAERAEELYRYTRNELQNRVDAGLLKQEVADEWSKKYPNYVPTGRDGDFGGEYDIWDIRGQLKGNTIGAGEIQKAVGGDQPIRSIKEQLADATSRNWRDMSMNNLFRKMFGDKIGDELAREADGGLEKVLDNTINLGKSKDGGKYFAEVFENGEMKRVEIEKRFYDAIEDLYKNGRFGNGIDVMTDAASKVAYPFKNLVTSWNPIFMIKNGLRDFPEAIINSRQTKEFLECMPAAIKELQSGGEFYTAFRNSGVSQANFVNLEEALTSGDNWLKRGVNKFATAQEMVETYPRLIEYMATIKKARYDLKNGIKDVPMNIRDIAAANAADVTVNFGRSGSVGKMLNRGLVPFFNPSVQGWSKFLRNFSEQGSAKSFVGFSVKALALGAGVQAVNNFMLEDNPNYQQISARDKATNIIIPITWGNDVNADNTNLFVKIPKSRFAATLSLPMVNAGNENKMGWAEMLKVAGDQVAPVDPSESNILSPLLLARQNKTWYGSPIVPKALEDLPKSEQYDANTSWFGKTLGKATANLPEELQISPKKADYIIDAESGVIGDFLLPATTPSRQGGGNALQKAGHSSLNVLKRSFTIDSTTQNDLSTRFYDKMQKANTASQSAKGTQADKDEYARLSGYSKEVSKISKAITTLQNGNRKTKQEDIYGLQKVRNQMMQDAIDGKGVPSEYKAMDAVQKYVGTTYAINNFGSSADREAMKVYGASKYGNLTEATMQKRIDADKDFYNGVRAIGGLEDKMSQSGIDSNTVLTKAIALASVNAEDEMFGAYQCTKKSRTETADKMARAKTYLKSGGSVEEYVKLEKARKTLGTLPDYDKEAELDKALNQLKSNKISEDEYYKKQSEIVYNANISYLGLATSLAQANSPARGYALYDIKASNIRKGINLAAMGFTARDYREMAKAVDADGNGYPKKQEIIDYVAKSNVKDKATLYDALYYYKSSYNPFGKVTNYSRAQAAKTGKANGVDSISSDSKDFEIKDDSEKSGGYSGYRRYGRRRRYRRRGYGGSKAKAAKPVPIKASDYKADKPSLTKVQDHVSSAKVKSLKSSGTSGTAGSGSSKASNPIKGVSSKKSTKSLAETLKTADNATTKRAISKVEFRTAEAMKASAKKRKKKKAAPKSGITVAKIEPPKVKFKKYEV